MSDRRIPVGDGNALHVRREGENDYEVWLNTNAQDFDGLCVGCGVTEAAAMKDAEEVLTRGVTALRKGQE